MFNGSGNSMHAASNSKSGLAISNGKSQNGFGSSIEVLGSCQRPHGRFGDRRVGFPEWVWERYKSFMGAWQRNGLRFEDV